MKSDVGAEKNKEKECVPLGKGLGKLEDSQKEDAHQASRYGVLQEKPT